MAAKEKTHRDSVGYWEKVTDENEDNSLAATHPSAGKDVFSRFFDKMPLEAGMKVLDIGVGFGRFVPQYAAKGVDIYGIDVDPNMVERCADLHPGTCCELACRKAEQTGFDDDMFDGVVCWAVFDELDQASSLAEMNRVLNPGGTLLITGKNACYHQDDTEAAAAEKGARSKGHCNNFTMVDELDWAAYGFTILEEAYCARRGDFAKSLFLEERPERFYEYILILKKMGNALPADQRPPVAHAYSINWLERNTDWTLPKQKYGKSDSPAILLSGVYRSGTTILKQILGAHPDIYLTYDSIKFLRFCMDKFDPIEERGKELMDDVERRLTHRWEIDFSSEKAMELVSRPDYASHYDAGLQHLRDQYKPEAKLYGEKNAVVWGRVPDFLRMFPNGKVIHIMRDPRDATASYKKITYEPGLAFMDCALNCLNAMTIIPKYKEYFGADHVMIVKMEDLLEQPEIWACKMCEFLGVEYAPAMLDAGNYANKCGKAWEHNSAFGATQKPGISCNYKRYDKYLTVPERMFIEFITRSAMREYGYEVDSALPTKEEWLEMYTFFEDPFLKERLAHFLTTGNGIEGYPSDPTKEEINI